jgi:predicted nucleic acid-binding protein
VELSWGDGPWVADTSAWARARHPEVAPQWKAAAQAGEIIACPVITLELLYDAPDRDHVDAVAAALADLRQAPITRKPGSID